MAVNNISGQKTIQEIIDSTSQKASERNTGELGKDDFLNLLVTQLKYQDPLKPVDDKEFIGQMAQFSSLEQMQNMNSSMSNSQAFSLIGKRVSANTTDDKTKEARTVVGDVTGVKVSAGKVYVVVKGEDIPLDKVTDITESTRALASSDIAKYTNLIGFNVKGGVYDSKTGDIVSVDGVVKELQSGQYEDYAVMDGVKVEISDIVTTVPSTDPNFRESYLKTNKGKSVDVYVIDRSYNQKVPVTATLKDYTINPDGTISAVLDGLNVPVESISKIVPVKQESTTTNTNTTTNGNTSTGSST